MFANIFNTQRGKLDKAFELFGFICHPPKVDPEIVQTLAAVMPELKAGVRVETVRAAEERGKLRSLRETIEEIWQTE